MPRKCHPCSLGKPYSKLTKTKNFPPPTLALIHHNSIKKKTQPRNFTVAFWRVKILPPVWLNPPEVWKHLKEFAQVKAGLSKKESLINITRYSLYATCLLRCGSWVLSSSFFVDWPSYHYQRNGILLILPVPENLLPSHLKLNHIWRYYCSLHWKKSLRMSPMGIATENSLIRQNYCLPIFCYKNCKNV